MSPVSARAPDPVRIFPILSYGVNINLASRYPQFVMMSSNMENVAPHVLRTVLKQVHIHILMSSFHLNFFVTFKLLH